jgi:hypothetical protein
MRTANFSRPVPRGTAVSAPYELRLIPPPGEALTQAVARRWLVDVLPAWHWLLVQRSSAQGRRR